MIWFNIKQLEKLLTDAEVSDQLAFKKPNPFFGQLKLLYLRSFVDMMDDLYYGESLIFPYQGYLFPFLKNNLTMIEITTPQGRAWRNYSYTYSSDGYPLELFDGPTVDDKFLFEIIYR